MSFRILRPLIAGLSLLLICLLVVFDREQTSPGPLSDAHLQVPELKGQSCILCHGTGDQSLADACNACHEPVANQLAQRSGFHGNLAAPEDCGHCHMEHFGTDLPLVGKRAFAQAGIEAIGDYAHEGLNFGLVGGHEELACYECHANAEAPTLAVGEVRYLGLSQRCETCHEDPHKGLMEKSCQECHGQEQSFADLENFLHTLAFPLTGVHGASSCKECHDPASEYAVEYLGKVDSPPARACAECHESPHTQPFVVNAAAALEVQPAASCEACHSEHGAIQPFADYNAEVSAGLHGASGFELDAPHTAVSCADCHTPESQPNRRQDDCASCHDSPHGDQFLGGPFGGSDCLTCHDSTRFVPSIFDAETHVPTGFLLEEGHGSAECADCHQVPVQQTLGTVDFTVLESDCATCHRDVHAGQFVNASAQLEACDTCHNTKAFADVPHRGFDHTQWTGFDLTGSHQTADCETCHIPTPTPDEFGRSFGRVVARLDTQVDACSNCHGNVHVGQMKTTAEDCESCHNTSRFNEVLEANFDHSSWTGFPLVGAHNAAECESCHQPLSTPTADGRGFGFATRAHQDQCSACHSDPHAGKFSRRSDQPTVAPQTDCQACHNQSSFRDGIREGFDHELWTGFALNDAHAAAACADCHSTAQDGSLRASRGSRCSDCHDDAHYGQFGATGCARCHSSTKSFNEVTFDHAFDSVFALDDNHKDLDCARCHQPWPLASGGTTIRYKPLGTDCTDCHKLGPPK